MSHSRFKMGDSVSTPNGVGVVSIRTTFLNANHMRCQAVYLIAYKNDGHYFHFRNESVPITDIRPISECPEYMKEL